MYRFASLFVSVAASVLLLSATAASAQPNGNFYSAKPVVAAPASSLVVRDTIWKCDGNGCASATRGKSRPAFVCESLVKEVGQVATFRAGTEEFDADALARCNTKA
ncbi:MAG: CC_3452 family protein [Sphingomonadaceae bacterium]